jgi:hypothetical protein
MNSWQLIFEQSRVNAGVYDGERLPTQNWDWPRATWFQKRLLHLRRSKRRAIKTLDDHLHQQVCALAYGIPCATRSGDSGRDLQ